MVSGAASESPSARASVDVVAFVGRRGSLVHAAELGREHDLVAPALDRAAHQLLVAAQAVDVGGVEQGDPQLDRAVNHRYGCGVVGRTVDRAHSHAAQADGRDVDARGTEFPCFHAILFLEHGHMVSAYLSGDKEVVILVLTVPVWADGTLLLL
jgi:hypothetical protein